MHPATKAAVEMKMEIEIGMKVVHKITGLVGRVTVVEHVGGRTKLHVETTDGRVLRGLDRHEFFYTERRDCIAS